MTLGVRQVTSTPWGTPKSKQRHCHPHFNFSVNLNLVLNFFILSWSSTNNCSNKKPIGEPIKGRTHRRTYRSQWHINKTLWLIKLVRLFFEELWSSFIRFSYNKKLQQIPNRESCLIRKKCSHECLVPSTKIS